MISSTLPFCIVTKNASNLNNPVESNEQYYQNNTLPIWEKGFAVLIGS
jgi:hypothetical protein